MNQYVKLFFVTLVLAAVFVAGVVGISALFTGNNGMTTKQITAEVQKYVDVKAASGYQIEVLRCVKEQSGGYLCALLIARSSTGAVSCGELEAKVSSARVKNALLIQSVAQAEDPVCIFAAS